MKNIKVKVIGSQFSNSRKEEKIELLTEAVFYNKNDYSFIEYEEGNLSDMESSKTILKFNKDKFIMTKLGSSSTKLEFEVDKKYNTVYMTSVGQFNIEIFTTKYINGINDENKGNIDIEYTINLPGVGESVNKLHIEII